MLAFGINNIRCSTSVGWRHHHPPYLKRQCGLTRLPLFSSASKARRMIRSSSNNTEIYMEEEYPYEDYKYPSERSSGVRWSQVMFSSPDFVFQETEKFREALTNQLEEKDMCGDKRDLVIKLCTTIFNHFLREYDGPVFVDPFGEMNAILDDIGDEDGPFVARKALLWAAEHLEKDWEEWNAKVGSEKSDISSKNTNKESEKTDISSTTKNESKKPDKSSATKKKAKKKKDALSP